MRWSRVIVAGALALGLCACTASHISGTYGAVAPEVVTLGCRETYEVYDKREARQLLVVSNLWQEIGACGRTGGDAPKLDRFREAAQAYLDRSRRPGCRIMGGTELSRLHGEFAYACAAPGTATSSSRPG